MAKPPSLLEDPDFVMSIYFAAPADAFFVLVAAQFLGLSGVLIYNVPLSSHRQAMVKSELQGRINATMRTTVWGMLPVGSLLGGFVGQAIGVHATIGLMTVLGAPPFLFALFSAILKVRGFPE